MNNGETWIGVFNMSEQYFCRGFLHFHFLKSYSYSGNSIPLHDSFWFRRSSRAWCRSGQHILLPNSCSHTSCSNGIHSNMVRSLPSVSYTKTGLISKNSPTQVSWCGYHSPLSFSSWDRRPLSRLGFVVWTSIKLCI